MFSARRPAPIPGSAPFGQVTHDLYFDAFITHPGFEANAQTLIYAFREAEAGNPLRMFDLFADLLEPDCHAVSLFEKRNEAVSGKPFVIQAGGEGGDAELAAHVLRVVFGDQPMVETFQHLLGFNKDGHAAAEMDWTVRIVDGRPFIVPSCFTGVPARRFLYSNIALDGVDNELRLYADIKRPRGDALTPYKWIVVKRDNTTRLGCLAMMRNLAWSMLGKRYSTRDWIKFSARFGRPLPVARYDQTASDDQSKDIAREVIANIGNDVGAAVPKSIDFDFKEVKGVDNSKTHGGLIAHCNAEMSKRVNGSTLTSDNAAGGGGSYGLGDVHDAVRWEAVQYDAERLETAFNTQVFAPFMRFNGLTGPMPQMKIQVVRDLDPNTRIDVMTKAVNLLGVEASKSQVRQELGIREPTNPADKVPGAPVGAEPMAKTPNPKIKETT